MAKVSRIHLTNITPITSKGRLRYLKKGMGYDGQDQDTGQDEQVTVHPTRPSI